MKVAIVKYNAGNIQSVKNALERLAAESVVTDEPALIESADRVIFPGVGEASTAMRYLSERGLDKAIRSLSQPVLAICLGMQLLCSRSEENDTAGLGLLPCKVKRMPSDGVKIPHIGWNTINGLSGPLCEGVAEGSRVYFVHSYFVGKNESTIAETSYPMTFSAAIAHKNFFGVQFHPEKSGPVGRRILENFMRL